MSVTKTRHLWIDVAKGIGIILMLLGHLPIPYALYKAIHSFNMPCFFLLAGLVFSTKHAFTTFFIQKMRLLIKPYFIFSFASFILWLSLRPYSNTLQKAAPDKVLYSIFYGSNSAYAYMAHNVPLWFLPCVFVSFLLFYGLTRLPKAWHTVAAILCVAANYGLAQAFTTRLPWSMDVALVSVGFMSLGYLGRSFFLNTKIFSLPALIGVCFINLIFCFMNNVVDMNYNQYGQIALFWIAALSGIFFIINIAKSLCYFPKIANVFCRIGQNSLYILCAHNMVFIVMNGVFHRLYNFCHVNLSLIDLPRESMDGIKIALLLLYLVVGLVFSRQAKKWMTITFNKLSFRRLCQKWQISMTSVASD